MINSKLRYAAAAAVLCLASASASAGIYSFDVSGVESWGDYGDAENEIFLIDVAAELGLASGTAVTVEGVGWDVIIDTFGGPSWLSEASVALENSDASDGVFLSPGAGNDFPGGPTPFSSGGIIDLTLIDDGMGGNLAFDLFDGILRLEFFEGFDDDGILDPPAVDALWVSGALTIDASASQIPLPAALPLLLSALGIGAVAGRRRKID